MPKTHDYLTEMAALPLALPADEIDRAIALLWDNYKAQRRVVFCGNGESAATASHLPADFQKSRFLRGGRSWECLSQVDSVPLPTAWGNDTEYAQVFAGQAKTWLRPGDLLVAISAVPLGWSGFGGGKLADTAPHNIVVRKNNRQMVEDAHSVIGPLIFTALLDLLAAEAAF